MYHAIFNANLAEYVKLFLSARVSYDDPSYLFVLLEEELIVVDLESEGWPVFIAPYLATVHSTAITCTAYVSDVRGTFWNKIMEAGQRQSTGFSCRVINSFTYVLKSERLDYLRNTPFCLCFFVMIKCE